jgi:hypothetical protein
MFHTLRVVYRAGAWPGCVSQRRRRLLKKPPIRLVRLGACAGDAADAGSKADELTAGAPEPEFEVGEGLTVGSGSARSGRSP